MVKSGLVLACVALCPMGIGTTGPPQMEDCPSIPTYATESSIMVSPIMYVTTKRRRIVQNSTLHKR